MMSVYSKPASLLVLLLSFLFLITPVWLGGELIAPTRTLQGTKEAQEKLTVVSEPPGLDAFLDGSNIGKTPVWLKSVEPGLHTLKVKDSETKIHVQPGKTLQVSLFKGSFIKVAKEEKRWRSRWDPRKRS